MSQDEFSVVVELDDIVVTIEDDPSIDISTNETNGLEVVLAGNIGPPGPAGESGSPGADSTVPGPSGPPGDSGPPGEDGEQGPPGADSIVPGPKGDTGDTGPQGEPGPAGADSTVPGPKGDIGNIGPPGPQGEDGEPGADSTVPGPKGDTGAQGVMGETGPQGETGETGDIGPQGETGDIGPKGDTGSLGPSGEDGEPGADSTIPGPKGEIGPQGETGDTGPQGETGEIGPQGVMGETGLKGDGGPPGEDGEPGADSIVPGPKGDTGNTGSQGETGDTGPQGETGDTGPAGADSIVPGPPGPPGEDGEPGADSIVPGPKGATGPAGADSIVPGPKGDTGDTGPVGEDGAQGIQGPPGEDGEPGVDSIIPGPEGPRGETGSWGGAVSIPYLANLDQDAPFNPGSGVLLFQDPITQTGSTVLSVSTTDKDGNDWSDVLALLANSSSVIKGELRLASVDDPNDYVFFEITDSVYQGGYYDITVSGVGATALFTDEQELMFLFTPNGDKGDTGITGSRGIPGLDGEDGEQGLPGMQGDDGEPGPVDIIVQENINGILVDYDPPGGIDNCTVIELDPSAMPWSANDPTIAVPQGYTYPVNPLPDSPNDVLWTSKGIQQNSGFWSTRKSSAGILWISSSMRRFGISGAVEPTYPVGGDGTVADGGIRWSVSPYGDTLSLSAWAAATAVVNNTQVIRNGDVWAAISFLDTKTGAVEPNWASVAHYGDSISDNHVIWFRLGKYRGAWTALTSYGINIDTTDATKLYGDFVAVAGGTKLLGWFGAFGTFATTSGSEPTWNSGEGENTEDNEVLWVRGSDFAPQINDGGSERWVMTGLAEPAEDGAIREIVCKGTDLMSGVLADKSRITDSYGDDSDVYPSSRTAFDFGGDDITLQVGEIARVIYDADSGTWFGGKTPDGPPGGGVTLGFVFGGYGAADTDPGSGILVFSGFSSSPTTSLRVSTVDSFSADIADILDMFDDSTSTIKGYLRVFRIDDPTKWAIFSISAVVNPSSDYRNITVAYVGANQATPFQIGHHVALSFTRTGDKGTTGNTGSTGSQGIQGLRGIPGLDGEEGEQGPPGPPGMQGPQGSQGTTGSQGAQGNSGSPGIDGEDGEPGPLGPQGTQGPQGSQGIQGITGAQGNQGPPGLDVSLLDDLIEPITAYQTVITSNRQPPKRTVISQQDISAAGFVDITKLTEQIYNGRIYMFEACVYFRSSIISMGVLFGWNGPAMTDKHIFIEKQITIGTTASTDMLSTAELRTTDTPLPNSTAEPEAAATQIVRITGMLRPSADGTFALRFSKENVAGTASIMPGSWLQVEEIG